MKVGRDDLLLLNGGLMIEYLKNVSSFCNTVYNRPSTWIFIWQEHMSNPLSSGASYANDNSCIHFATHFPRVMLLL